MTTITIVPENPGSMTPGFRAIAGKKQAEGKSAGEALDALTAQLDPNETGTLVVVQQLQADSFFSADKQRRLQELMDRWRKATASHLSLPSDEQAELDALVEAEWRAATLRAQSMVRGLAP